MARRPPMAVTSVTIGAPAPRDLAAFYAQLLGWAGLGWTVTASEPARPGMPPEDGWAQLRPSAGEDGPTLNFEYEAKFTRPVWPAADGGQNATQHLEIAVADLDETVRWAIAAGAILADVQPQEHVGSCSTQPGIRSASKYERKHPPRY
jgi:catechol 2,3-dioxygenase-like lactoylglutathione lyase family enzyme